MIDSRVDRLYRSGAIMDLERLVQTMTRLVRAIWVADGLVMRDTTSLHLHPRGIGNASKFLIVTCFNLPCYGIDICRDYIRWMEISRDDNNNSSGQWCYYSPGTADNDKKWG